MKQDESQSLEKEVRSAAFNNATNRETRTVTLDVTPGAYGRYRKLHINLDQEVFLTSVRLNREQQVEIEIPNDALFLYGKMDWLSTEKIDLRGLRSGDVIRIVCASFSELMRISFKGMFSLGRSPLTTRLHIKIFLDRKTR
tara:strand:- start:50 stop:472 length:423 start_codon:yes stop_codon:yes gene_type:complete